MLKRVFGAMGLAIAMQMGMSQEAPMTPLRPDPVAFLALYNVGRGRAVAYLEGTSAGV